MNRLKNTGLVLCGLVLGLSLSAPAAQAVESLKATLSTNRILVDGQETHMTAYTIGGSNYVRLRDIGKAVGFEVYWDSENGCVQVESGKPYTGEEPAKDEVIKPVPQPEPTVPANDADVDAMKQDIVDRTNVLRREQGISALTVNAKLMQAAQVRAEEMAASGAYSHTRPDGRKIPPLRTARMSAKTSTASRIGLCRANRYLRSPYGHGISPVGTVIIFSKRITLKPVWDLPEASMTTAMHAGTASNSSYGTAIP